MLQSFTTETRPTDGPPRLARLRAHLTSQGLDGFIVPRADAHQGEYVAACDARLQWLTGFSGSAGMCIVLPDVAGVFIDGRYRLQVRTQVDLAHFTPVPWPEITPGGWLKAELPAGGIVGYDPWLHTKEELDRLHAALAGTTIRLRACANMVDAIWPNRPAPPKAPAFVQPTELSGESAADKRARIAAGLKTAGVASTVLSLPDSICWLLNIRGADLPRNPVVQCFAILQADGKVDLFLDPAKLTGKLRAHMGTDVRCHAPQDLGAMVAKLTGPVGLDPSSAPVWLRDRLQDAGTQIMWAPDPCILPKARKNPTEIAATTAAHLRDAGAMTEFLAWLSTEAPKGALSEIDVVRALEGFRQATGALHDISFDTICGAGPNGAIVHYRVTEETNRKILPDTLLLVDSGGQYRDGTTDITRTIAIGTPSPAQIRAFTRVLQGMIALSRARWPKGLAGRDLDVLARAPLWAAGQDFDHGTGHGVGVFLSVHEGPQRISRGSECPLEPGMIVSNEPGYYREGAFGIRIENLLVVQDATTTPDPSQPELPDADDRAMLRFDTLTWVPIDRTLIDLGALSDTERAWIDGYHADILARVGPKLSAAAHRWLRQAARPLGTP